MASRLPFLGILKKNLQQRAHLQFNITKLGHLVQESTFFDNFAVQQV
jgi:hypothetical protein